MIDYRHADGTAIAAYNGRRKTGSPTWLQAHMPPAPYDGDPFKAKIVLLLNNPMFLPGESVPEDHSLNFDGWPLAGLNPSVRIGFRKWYYRPFGYLIKEKGCSEQSVSRSVAIVQINPWASQSFDLGCKLPSRNVQVEIAKGAVDRGAIVIVGRSAKFWSEHLRMDKPNVLKARYPRNPTLSPNGLGITSEEFDAVVLSRIE